MSNVVNLRRFRKRKAREDADRIAAENRARFGRTPAEKAKDQHEAEEARRKLEQRRRDPPTDS